MNTLASRMENNSHLLLSHKSLNKKSNILPKVKHSIASRSSFKIKHNFKPRILKTIPASNHKIIKSCSKYEQGMS